MKLLLTLDKKLRSNLLILFAAGLLFWCSMASFLPTLPLYVDHIGGTKQEVGIVMGSFAIGLLSFRTRLGRFSDRKGRKIVLIIGTLVVTIAPLLYIGTNSIYGLIAIRAFHGISIAAFSTAYTALVADLAPEENRGEIIGYMSLVSSLGVAIGPAVGSYLVETAGYPQLFLFASGLGFVSILFSTQITNPPINSSGQKNNKSKFWQLFANPKVRVPAIILLLVGLNFGSMRTFVPLFIKSTDAGLNPGLFYTASATAGFSVRLLVGRAADRYGRGLFVSISLVLYVIALVNIWSANSSQSFLISGAIEGAGLGMLIPMISAIIADRALPEERGRMFGFCLTGFDLGIAIAGPVLGTVAEEIGYRNIFAFSAALSCLAFLIFITQSSKDVSHSLGFAFGRGQDLYALNQIDRNLTTKHSQS